MKTKYIIIILLASILLSSCEKVIELDLKDADVQTVVEAQVNNGLGNNYVILSKSGSYYDSNDFEMIKNAQVQITNSDGNSYSLYEIHDGYYQNSNLNGQVLSEYKLEINNGGETIISNSIMSHIVPIDSVSYEYKENRSVDGPGPGSGEKPGGGEKNYRVYVHFQDPADENNFYRFKTHLINNKYEDSFIMNDDMFDGKATKIPLRNVYVFTGDTLIVELYHIDRANYEYFKVLEDNGMSAFSTSVGNPVSNVEGKDVIGIFGANALDIDTLIIK